MYKVLVDDNFHYMDESEQYEAGSYSVLEEAINRCKEITLESLKEYYEKGISPSKLRAQWLMFGEDPFIRGAGRVVFSARDYITDEMCEEIIAEHEGQEGVLSSVALDQNHKPPFSFGEPPEVRNTKGMETSMIVYTAKIQEAIRFSIKTHEVYQKQKRKGKDISYVTHPLTAGLILTLAGASEDVIVAGILHDTVEDSIEEKKVTEAMIAERFGSRVAELVLSVTETDKELTWEERKIEALEHIKAFSQESVLLKSADVISNMTELLDDCEREGEGVWDRFNAPKEKILGNAHKVISALIAQWQESPLAADLQMIDKQLAELN